MAGTKQTQTKHVETEQSKYRQMTDRRDSEDTTTVTLTPTQ